MSSSIEKILSQMHMFRNVSSSDLIKFIDLCESKYFPTGAFVCRQGASATNALILVQGKLEVSVRSDSDIKHIGEIHSGEIFGEQGLFHSSSTRSANVMANQDSICLILTPKVMRTSAKNPAIVALEKHLIATMARRIRATNLTIQMAWKEAQREEERHQKKMQMQKDEKPTESYDKPTNSWLGKLKTMFGGKQ